jgi:hypothetical protein
MTEFVTTAALLRLVFITLVLGCGCAWLAGRAIALTWRPPVMVAGAAVLMGLAVRFIHFALFDEPLLAPLTTLGETVLLLAVALLAYRRTRALQMVRQYYWLYEPHGPLGWRPRRDGTPAS